MLTDLDERKMAVARPHDLNPELGDLHQMFPALTEAQTSDLGKELAYELETLRSNCAKYHLGKFHDQAMQMVQQ